MAATGTWKVYSRAQIALANKEIDWNSDDIRMAIMGSGYTPAQNTDDYWNDISTHEISGTGYTAGGMALTTPTTEQASNVVRYKAASPVTWSSSTITNATVLVIYDRTPGTDATRPLIAYCVLSSAQSSESGNFTVTLDTTNGIFTSTAST